jgi:hypothetical protein
LTLLFSLTGNGFCGARMVTGMRLPFHRSSGYVVQRAGLKLTFLLVVAAVEQAFGWDNGVVQLSSLCAGLCLVLATYNAERPTAADLNHWDDTKSR